ncbi:hypothetical protein QN277_024833 [Acacia crassicarpa]|uniref:Uncharacterized protein n=1 Tax=Acacia crassicarpa TaxID=499986 RepID=A0AAE1JD34_9FABA|nr:hypothetical protein QN277_024833 [Acacia crassicarpa]
MHRRIVLLSRFLCSELNTPSSISSSIVKSSRHFSELNSPSTLISRSSQSGIVESIVADGFPFDLNILPSQSQEISETESDSIEQEIEEEEELIHASETNGNVQTPS